MMKIDEILSRLQEQQPDISNPDELTDRIMDSLPDLPTEQPKPARRIRLYIVSAIAAAASVLLREGVWRGPGSYLSRAGSQWC